MGNVDVVRRLYAVLAARDGTALRALLAPDVEWIQNEGFPGGARRVGVDAVVGGVLGGLDAVWEGFRFPVEELLDAGGEVVALGEYRGTNRATGRPLRAAFAHVVTVRDGRVARFRQYTDTAMVRAAMA